jgi:hypothetical protein
MFPFSSKTSTLTWPPDTEERLRTLIRVCQPFPDMTRGKISWLAPKELQMEKDTAKAANTMLLFMITNLPGAATSSSLREVTVKHRAAL